MFLTLKLSNDERNDYHDLTLSGETRSPLISVYYKRNDRRLDLVWRMPLIALNLSTMRGRARMACYELQYMSIEHLFMFMKEIMIMA